MLPGLLTGLSFLSQTLSDPLKAEVICSVQAQSFKALWVNARDTIAAQGVGPRTCRLAAADRLVSKADGLLTGCRLSLTSPTTSASSLSSN